MTPEVSLVEQLMRCGLIVFSCGMSQGSVAQPPEPPEGCFCLAEALDIKPPQVQRGCERLKLPGNYYWSAKCRYRASRDARLRTSTVQNIDDRWRIVPEGETHCVPCQPPGRRNGEPPRGDGDTAPEETP